MMTGRVSWFGRAVYAAVVCVFLASAASAAITMETVAVGNAGNTADSTGYGAVSYDYSMGKYEVTAGQYTAFLNAVASTDTYGLYSTSMANLGGFGCNIQRSGASGSYTYSVASDWAGRPVNYVSWGSAARFVNWLHNGQPTGAQSLTTTEDGAYYLNGATSNADLLAVSREADWKYAIPTEDEWYKAAFHKNDGTTGNYFKYATSSDTDPSNVLTSPDPGNSANFYAGYVSYTIGSPYYRTEVGDFESSDSPYGTFDQSGNVIEYTEGINSTYRVMRGGAYNNSYYQISSSNRASTNPTGAQHNQGFRVVAVPEPTSMAILALGATAMLRRRRAVRRESLPDLSGACMQR